jgi:hypothetical protein
MASSRSPYFGSREVLCVSRDACRLATAIGITEWQMPQFVPSGYLEIADECRRGHFLCWRLFKRQVDRIDPPFR